VNTIFIFYCSQLIIGNALLFIGNALLFLFFLNLIEAGVKSNELFEVKYQLLRSDLCF